MRELLRGVAAARTHVAAPPTSAPQLDATNQGHRILQRLGWSPGAWAYASNTAHAYTPPALCNAAGCAATATLQTRRRVTLDSDSDSANELLQHAAVRPVQVPGWACSGKAAWKQRHGKTLHASTIGVASTGVALGSPATRPPACSLKRRMGLHVCHTQAHIPRRAPCTPTSSNGTCTQSRSRTRPMEPNPYNKALCND